MLNSRSRVVGMSSTFPDYQEPETQVLLANVGLIISRATMCETALSGIYSTLCGGVVAAVGFSSLVSMDAKIDQLNAALNWLEHAGTKVSHAPTFNADFKGILKKFKEAFKLRNNVAHAEARLVTYSLGDASTITRLVIRPGLLGIKGNDENFRAKWEYDSGDLSKIAETIKTWADLLWHIQFHLTFPDNQGEWQWQKRPPPPHLPQLSSQPFR